MSWGSASLRSCNSLLERVERNDPNLTDLVILPTKNFGAIDVERLASAVSANGQNNKLKSIQASGHHVPPLALHKLGQSIMNSRLTSISIGHASMGDEGVEAFCSGLELSNGGPLEIIDFEFKSIGVNGITAIAKTFGKSVNLTSLLLGRNEMIGDDGLESFVMSLQSVTTSEGSPFPKLKLLDLSACNITYRSLNKLVDVLALKQSDPRFSIILNSNILGALSGTSLTKLCSATSGSLLQSLSLKDCLIGDEGLLNLSPSFRNLNCTGLMSLNFSGNNIGIDGIKILAEAIVKSPYLMKSLKELVLSKNNLGSEAVVCLIMALQWCKDNDEQSFLSSLDLSETACGIEGAIKSLSCEVTTTLNLFNNNLQSKGFNAISPFLIGGHKFISNLDLGGNQASKESVYDLLKAIQSPNQKVVSSLRTLILGGNETGTNVQSLVTDLRQIRPELDIAFDRVFDQFEDSR